MSITLLEVVHENASAMAEPPASENVNLSLQNPPTVAAVPAQPDWCSPENWHEAANIFPLMPDDELQALADDIKANGQRNPIILLGGKVLDGRNRILACKLAGVRPDLQPRNPEKLGSPTAWVASQNLHRRQLTPTQRAFIAVEAEKLFAKEAKQRQLATLKQGDQTPVKQNFAERDKGQARDKAAAACHVNRQYVQDAKKISKTSPDAAVAAAAGKVSLAQAKAAASLREHHPDLAKQVLSGTLKPRDIKPRLAIVGPNDLKTRYAGKEFYQRIGMGLDGAFNGVKDRLDELTRIKRADWSPAAEEGLKNLIKSLSDVTERADDYAVQFKAVLKSHSKKARR